MAAVDSGAAEGRGAHALGDAFQQVLQRIGSFEERLRSIEQRTEEMVGRSLLSNVEGCDDVPGSEKRLAHLESRMEKLESSTETALQAVLPRVEALLKHLETPSLRVRSPHPNSISASNSTSGAASASAPLASSPASASSPAPRPLSSASASSPAPRPRSPSAGSAAPPPLTPERRKELGEQMFKAAEEGREADVRRLLNEGTDVNISNDFSTTPLMLATRCVHVSVVFLLIAKGADVKVSTIDGNTPLHYAAWKDTSGRFASLFIRKGALVDSANVSGLTPLHLAAWAGNEAAARVLLSAGASRGVRDNGGKTPEEHAATDNLRQLLGS